MLFRSVVDERYSSGEKAVSMSDCADFDGPESSTRRKWLEELMSRVRRVSCYFAGMLHHSAVVDVLIMLWSLAHSWWKNQTKWLWMM